VRTAEFSGNLLKSDPKAVCLSHRLSMAVKRRFGDRSKAAKTADFVFRTKVDPRVCGFTT